MKYENNFPPIPSAIGSFLGSQSLKNETLARIAATPHQFFVQGRYVQPRSMFARGAEYLGLKAPPQHIRGCAVVQLAFGGHVEEAIDTLDILSAHSSLVPQVIRPMLQERLGFVPELTMAINDAFEGFGNRDVLLNILEAIPVGAKDSLFVAIKLYERQRLKCPSLRRDKLLIRALHEHVHFARPIASFL